MEYNIGNYIYESDRMILYNDNIDVKTRNRIYNFWPITSSFDEELKWLQRGMAVQMSMEQRTVQAAGIALTANCGLRCNYCSQSSKEGKVEHITINDISVFVKDIIRKRIISSLVMKEKPLVEFYFTGGGEPTYNWSLFESAVQEIEKQCQNKKIQLRLAMTTNGILDSNQIEYIKKHFYKVLISYDGMPLTQNKNRKTAVGKETDAIVMQTIKDLSSGGVQVTIRTTIWHDDFKYLQDMCHYIHTEFGSIFSWDINPVTPAGRAETIMKSSNLKLYETDFLGDFLKLLDYKKQNGISFDITSPLLNCSPVGFNCGGIGLSVLYLWLLPDCKITTCIDSSDIITEVGRIEGGEVKYYDHFADPLLLMGISKFIECKNCIAFRVCGSGCPLKHIREEKARTGMIKWECLMEKNLWSHVLSEVVKGKELWRWKASRPKEKEFANVDMFILEYVG